MSTRVFVGGLTYKVRERDLEKFFRNYGRIKEISLKNGYAFMEFEDYRDAEDAVYEMNGKDLMGERVTVERARGTPRGSDRYRDSRDSRGYNSSSRRGGGGGGYGRDRGGGGGGGGESRGRDKYGPPTRTKYQVIIENLSSRCSWQDLKDFMRKAGEVTYADAHKQNPNEGVVEFASLEDMKNAIEKFDDTEINGRRIRVVESAKSTGGRKGSRSRSRSARRSRSKEASRSRSRSLMNDTGKKSVSRSRSRSRD